nr:uncharacterized protein LOC123754659 [Procambarus clarkii]
MNCRAPRPEDPSVFHADDFPLLPEAGAPPVGPGSEGVPLEASSPAVPTSPSAAGSSALSVDSDALAAPASGSVLLALSTPAGIENFQLVIINWGLLWSIAKNGESSVVVDAEAFFSSDHQPPTYMSHSLGEATSQPSPRKHSQHQSTENHPYRPQAAQEELARDNLLQGLWGDSRTTCRGLILDLTSSSNTTHLVLRLVEMSGLWRLPETVVVAIGGRAGARAVLLHHSLRNTVHALYLALDHALYLALDHALYLALNYSSRHLTLNYASLHLALNLQDASLYTVPHIDSRFGEYIPPEANDNSVMVYRRCLYCNNGEADVQRVLQKSFTSLPLPLDQLFQETFQDFIGKKMRIITAFSYFPYVDYKRVCSTLGAQFEYMDCLDSRLVNTLASKLNFTFEIYEDINHAVGVEKNGSYSGVIGYLQREEMDFSSIIAPTEKRLKAIGYMKTYPSDQFTVTSLKPMLLPKYLALIQPFRGELWVALVVSVVVWGATLWLLQRAWQKVAGGRRVDLTSSLLFGFGALLQNLPSDPSVSVSGRMLVGWWLVSCLIVTTGFTSSLVAHLTVQGRSRPLETFQDLVNQPGWRWATDPWMLTEAIVDYFETHPNPVFRKVYHKMEVLKVDEALKKVLAGGISFIGYKNYVTIIVEGRYTDARGNNPFFISNKAVPVLAALGFGIRRVTILSKVDSR